MKSFPALAQTKGYWLTKIQNDLYNTVEDYLTAHKMTRTQLAEKLKVSKGYVSQVLNGDFDHRLSKLIELSLAVGVVPNIKFQPADEYTENYINGYDFCINASNIDATITVNNRIAFSVSTDSRQDDYNEYLIDNEVDIYYSIGKSSKYEVEYV